MAKQMMDALEISRSGPSDTGLPEASDDPDDSDGWVAADCADDIWLEIIGFVADGDQYFLAAAGRRMYHLVGIVARRSLHTRWTACVASLPRLAWAFSIGVLADRPPELIYLAACALGPIDVVQALAAENPQWANDTTLMYAALNAATSSDNVEALESIDAFARTCTADNTVTIRANVCQLLDNAAAKGSFRVCRLLLSIRCAPTKRQFHRHAISTAFLTAAKNNHPLLARLLAQNVSAIHYALPVVHEGIFYVAASGHPEIAKTFAVSNSETRLRAATAAAYGAASAGTVIGPPIEPLDGGLKDLLMRAMQIAAAAGRTDACQWLMSCAELGELQKISPLSPRDLASHSIRAAAVGGSVSLCQSLLRAGAPWHPGPSFLADALSAAAAAGHVEVCRLIVPAIDAVRRHSDIVAAAGETARRGHLSVCRFLLDAIGDGYSDSKRDFGRAVAFGALSGARKAVFDWIIATGAFCVTGAASAMFGSAAKARRDPDDPGEIPCRWVAECFPDSPGKLPGAWVRLCAPGNNYIRWALRSAAEADRVDTMDFIADAVGLGSGNLSLCHGFDTGAPFVTSVVCEAAKTRSTDVRTWLERRLAINTVEGPTVYWPEAIRTAIDADNVDFCEWALQVVLARAAHRHGLQDPDPLGILDSFDDEHFVQHKIRVSLIYALSKDRSRCASWLVRTYRLTQQQLFDVQTITDNSSVQYFVRHFYPTVRSD